MLFYNFDTVIKYQKEYHWTKPMPGYVSPNSYYKLLKVRKMKKLVFVLLFAASYATMLAQNPKIVTSDKTGWHKIGETTVDFKNESDQMLVLGADRFASVKIKVTESPINLISFDIYFENGEKQSVTVGEEI